MMMVPTIRERLLRANVPGGLGTNRQIENRVSHVTRRADRKDQTRRAAPPMLPIRSDSAEERPRRRWKQT
jgi:hypothetical protein